MDIDKRYNYWRIHLLFSIYIGYVVYYFTRKSLNFAMPLMMEELHLSYADVGLMTTLFYIIYGSGKFFSGMVIDKNGSHFFMGLGLIASGIINIFFGLSSSFVLLLLFWLLNAFFQSWGWPSCANVLAHWYSRNERGFWWAISNTSLNVAGAIVPIVIGAIALHWGWRFSFILPGCVAICVGVFLCISMRGKPEKMGLPKVGDWRQDKLEQKHESIGLGMTFFAKVWTYVLANKFMWLLSGAYLLIYVVRTAINDWGSIYLVKQLNFDILTANTVLSFFEIGGILGCLFAGWGSDKLFAGNRAPMTLVFAVGIFFSALTFWITPIQNQFILGFSLFTLGFFVFGPILLITMMASECSHKSIPGTATGFIGACGYIGAALAGFPLSYIIEHFGWNGFFVVTTLAATGVGLLVLPFVTLENQIVRMKYQD